MDIQKFWEKALKETEVVRARIQGLSTFGDTNLPYILLSESAVNEGDTVVRSGEVVVEKPALVLPPNIPQFSGFEFEDGVAPSENALINFLLVRGVTLPSLRYNNRTYSLNVFEGRMSAAVRHYREDLQLREDVLTGLVVAPEDCWQFSLLIFICSQISRNAETDIRKLIDEYRKRKKED